MTDPVAVAELVARGDPERWRAAMTAPPPARPGLLALYAFNLEIARAPWAASEPALAQIRLRWWQDALDEILRRRPAPAARGGGTPRCHHPRQRPAARRLFEEMIAARVADTGDEPLADRVAVDIYIDHTAGHLMDLAARHLGAEGAALPVVRDFARGAGTAALLRALPELRSRGRDPLPGDASSRPSPATASPRSPRARSHRARVPRAAAPALLAGWQAERVLRRVARDARAAVEAPEIGARASLLWRGLSGRW